MKNRKALFFAVVFLCGAASSGFLYHGCKSKDSNGSKTPVCGNNKIEEGEVCDGTDLAGETCGSLGFDGGTLACLADCSGFDTSGCTHAIDCGNNIAQEGQVCDGTDLRGETCGSLGLDSGNLACRADCLDYDVSDCLIGAECGNNVAQYGEYCDGHDLRGESCESLGFGEGNLGCNVDCTYNTSDCESGPVCGNNTKELGEVCDGTDLGGVTCASLGLQGGTLGCLEDCSGYDISGCDVDPSGVSWISIPGSTFDMGSHSGHTDELPVRSVTVDGFDMTKSQVTVAQYANCVSAGECSEPGTGWSVCNTNTPGNENQPINCIDWFQATDFCDWIGGRLPSEAEWEYAARSAGQNITFPWGDEFANCNYAVMNEGGGAGCGTGRTMPVCSKPDGNTNQGLCDMAGNLWEWVQDIYQETYEGAPNDGSAWEDSSGSTRVFRGGAFNSDTPYQVRAAIRGHIGPNYYYDFIGFRCAR